MRWLRWYWLVCLVGLAGCQSVLNPVRPDPDKDVGDFEAAHGSSLSHPRSFANSQANP
jgi:hypothetical protein